MSLIFQETLENKPYLILNISSDPLIRYAWSRLARASSSSRWRRSFSWRRRSFSWRSCSTWARSCCNSSRTEKGTDTGSNTLIDAIAASSLHIRLDSYSASPRRKRQGSANQIPEIQVPAPVQPEVLAQDDQGPAGPDADAAPVEILGGDGDGSGGSVRLCTTATVNGHDKAPMRHDHQQAAPRTGARS